MTRSQTEWVGTGHTHTHTHTHTHDGVVNQGHNKECKGGAHRLRGGNGRRFITGHFAWTLHRHTQGHAFETRVNNHKRKEQHLPQCDGVARVVHICAVSKGGVMAIATLFVCVVAHRRGEWVEAAVLGPPLALPRDSATTCCDAAIAGGLHMHTHTHTYTHV